MKNKKMGILAVLVMLVAVTLNAVGGTYAKYISAYDMTDQARVAKWDFNETPVNTVDLFHASYKNDHGVYVASADGAKVVAPGTEGEYTYKITGTAETNYQVSKSIKIVNRIALDSAHKYEAGEEKADYENGKAFYNPIEFCTEDCNVEANWKKATEPVYEDGKFVGLVLEIKEANPTIYPANFVLEDKEVGSTAVTGTIKWRWKFETGTKTESTGVWSNDVLDTALAQQVEKYNLNMTASVGVTIVQTQDAPTYVEGETVKATKAPATFTNRLLDSEDVKWAVNTIGYDSNNSRDVIFDGKTLTGTIYKTDTDYAERYNGKELATGYYYPITVTAADIAKIEFRKGTDAYADKTGSLFATPGQEGKKSLSLVVGLEEGKNLSYKITYTDGTVEEHDIINKLAFK